MAFSKKSYIHFLVVYIRMNTTRKVICYTGIGARKNAKHTRKNFGKIIKKQYSRAECKRLKNLKKEYGFKRECPKKGNINGWIDFFGAGYTSPEACNSIVKNNKLLYNQLIAK
jgi:hypothetical protein